MGDYQNYGPFLGPYYSTGPNTGPNLGDPKKDHNFDSPPHELDLGMGFEWQCLEAPRDSNTESCTTLMLQC